MLDGLLTAANRHHALRARSTSLHNKSNNELLAMHEKMKERLAFQILDQRHRQKGETVGQIFLTFNHENHYHLIVDPSVFLPVSPFRFP